VRFKASVDKALIQAAEENAKHWVWGPFPARFDFPWYQNVHYVYKLEGKKTHFPIVPARIRTRLPDEVEVVAIPCEYNPLSLPPAPQKP